MKFKVGDIVQINEEGIANHLDGCSEADRDFALVQHFTGGSFIGEVTKAEEDYPDEPYEVLFGDDKILHYNEMTVSELTDDELDLVDSAILKDNEIDDGWRVSWLPKLLPKVYAKAKKQCEHKA